IAANDTPERIAEGAREAGMRGLWESGVQHVRNGITSVEELLRVLEAPVEQTAAPARPSIAAPRASVGVEAPPENGAAAPPRTPRSTAAIQADILPPPEKGRVQTLHSKPPSIFTG